MPAFKVSFHSLGLSHYDHVSIYLKIEAKQLKTQPSANHAKLNEPTNFVPRRSSSATTPHAITSFRSHYDSAGEARPAMGELSCPPRPSYLIIDLILLKQKVPSGLNNLHCTLSQSSISSVTNYRKYPQSFLKRAKSANFVKRNQGKMMKHVINDQ